MTSEDFLKELESIFVEHYQTQATIIAFAPGRAEILGNHTDYNEGYVLSVAIQLGTYFLLAPRTDEQIVLYSHNMKDEQTFSVSNVPKAFNWSDYVRGIVVQLRERATLPHGFNAVVGSLVPLGAGLSSSAALEVSTTLALAELYKLTGIDNIAAAKICQSSENKFVGLNCGLLDPISSLFGAPSALVMSDFRTLHVQTVPVPDNICFLVCNTHVTHALVGSEYNRLREHCETGAQYFATALAPKSVSHLRDVSAAEFAAHRGGLAEATAQRTSHIVGENERVLQAAALLPAGQVSEFGRLMFASHASSRDDFQNSCLELDTVVRIAQEIGALGARLSGGGFGGSAVVLIPRADEAKVSKELAEKYHQQTGKTCSILTILPSAGAHLLRR